MTDTKNWNALPVIEWLLSEGRLDPAIENTVFGLGEKLREVGAPINRLRVSMRTLHPLITAVTVMWELGASEPGVSRAPHGLENRPAYRGSPLKLIAETRKPFRKKLTGTLGPADHNVLHELKESGATDYYGTPMHFTGARGGLLVVTSDFENGFSDHDIAEINMVAAALAPVAELYNASSISSAISEVYLGQRSGRQVLEGKITRGDIEKIESAILMTDIRGWTTLSSQLPAEEALDLVNRFFETAGKPIEAYGGEILKFMGDGLLAIFPAESTIAGKRNACEAALEASLAMRKEARSNEDLNTLRFGIGLNFGEVLYGNIGSQTRLDFTVLGQAVNVASRIEGLCASFGEPVLISEKMRDHLGTELRKVGESELKGLDGTHTIYAPQTL